MESDEGKVFVGGISWDTDERKLREHFSKYGAVADAVVMRDRPSGRPRGFAFVVLSDPSLLPSLLHHTHVIDGRTVDVKHALSRGEQHASGRSTNPFTGRAMVGRTGEMRTKKIFVGGLPSSLTEEAFHRYFEAYGAVTDVVIMFDQSTRRPRGFGFISFNSEDAVDRVLHKTFHELDGKLVEVKRALPKEANPGGRLAGGGSTIISQPFGSSNASAGSYDGRADGNRYMQQQVTGGGYHSCYGVPGYGYGSAGGAVGYGGYGMGGGYGGAGGYVGNPPAGGYVGGPLGAHRSPRSGQLPSGYGPGGYGPTSGYATAGGWSGPTAGGSGSFAPGGRLPSGTGYGSQGYGNYGGYGAGDGQHQVGAYGAAVGGRGGHPASAGGSGNDQGAGSSYNTGGYGDVSGAAAYPNTWSTEPQRGGYA